MKNVSMITARRIAVIFLALALLFQTVPVFAESSASFSNTHWYVSSVSSDYASLLDKDSQLFMALLGSMVELVPYRSWLEGYSMYAVYIGLDLNANGSFTLTSLTSENGVIDWSTYESVTGSWRYSSNVLILTNREGGTVRLGYRGGKLLLNLYGIVDMTFEQA